ncbi:MAG: M2 family metallopeptidase, partial [Candidatus Gastranaerophilaceae bacterium]
MVNNISGGNQINKIILNNTVKSPKVKEEQLQNNPKQTLAPFNSAYVTPFINQVSYTQNEKDFIEYRDKFCEVLKEVDTEYNKADWNFYINSTAENANTLNIISSMYDEIYGDKEAYEKFKEFEEKGINDANLQKHLNKLLGNFSCGESEETEETAPIEEENNSGEEGTYFVSENEISEVFNNFKPQIDGKEVSETDINEIFHNSKDIELREKAYIAENSAGDAIADDLIQLVKQRNEEAKAYGYDNYYSMMLEQYGTSEEELFGLLDDLDKKTSKIYE